MRNLPHLTYLEAFEAAARHQSFTKAAEELNCTQSAISQRVRALEQYFSRPLFHRHRNGLELSAVGEAYLPGITEALDVAEAATQGLTGIQAPRSVTVSAPNSFVVLWLSRHLPEFNHLHPDIEVRINSTIWTDPNVDLADLSIVMADSKVLADGALPLGREFMALVCHPDATLELENLGIENWVNSSKQVVVQGKHQLWQRWAKSKGIELRSSIAPIKVDNANAALALASENGGLVVTFSSYYERLVQNGTLISPVGPDEPTSLKHILVKNLTRKETISALTFRKWISGKFPLPGTEVKIK